MVGLNAYVQRDDLATEVFVACSGEACMRIAFCHRRRYHLSSMIPITSLSKHRVNKDDIETFDRFLRDIVASVIPHDAKNDDILRWA